MKIDEIQKKLYYIVAKSPVGYTGKMVTRKKQERIILAYHGVAPGHPSCLSPNIFREHIAYLRKKYDIVPINEIVNKANDHSKPKISISFDDAYINLLEHAVPILQHYEIPAIFYVPTNYLGKKNEWDSHYSLPLLQIMTVKDLQILHSKGFIIGSHTQNHISLKGKSLKILQQEVGKSKTILENIIGDEIQSFAYPYGGRSNIDYQVIRIVEESEYSSAVTSYWGRFNDWNKRYELRRITIWPSDNLAMLSLKLNGYYDWLTPEEVFISVIRTILTRYIEKGGIL
mgnify:CR=1 FL=1